MLLKQEIYSINKYFESYIVNVQKYNYTERKVFSICDYNYIIK